MSLVMCALMGITPRATAQEHPATARFKLPNGLDVFLQEDHRQKLVAVRMSYAAGSRNEAPDERGLAHLVEHLTFRGSRHLKDGELWRLYELAGASDMNGQTFRDET